MKTYGAIVMALLSIFCSANTASYASIPPSVLNPGPAKVHRPPPKPIIAKTSCYYRVLKGQRKYATSYLGDIRLNGTGITHSGKLVRVGFLAADLRYHPIGEKFHVFVDGKDHGIWTVEDKGGAIKGPRRFDLCAGKGDRGRALAAAWGMGEGHVVKMYPINRVGRNS